MSDIGFHDPTIGAARAFRVILDAMSRPGRICRFVEDVRPPAPLSPAMATVALTLCDVHTPLWLCPELESPAVCKYLQFHTGVRLVGAQGEASFALISRGAPMPPLATFAQGTHEYPDRSATLVIEVEAFSIRGLEFSGPGIAGSSRSLAPALPTAFWHELARNHEAFPLGVDVIFCSGSEIMACPRSTTIRFPEAA